MQLRLIHLQPKFEKVNFAASLDHTKTTSLTSAFGTDVTAATPQLLIHLPIGTQRRSLLGQTTWTLGRHPSNDLSFPENSISRYHARVEILQSRHCLLVDLNSRNGSAVNQQPVSTPILLKHGDRIQLGYTELQFEHSLFLPSDHATTAAQVVMVHQSALQGSIWQEVLLSQNLTVRWESPTTDLKSSLARSAAIQALPKVLIIDIPAFESDLDAFCRWCQQQYPALALLLINSQQRQISLGKRQQMIALGCLDVLPAFREPNLLDNVAGVVVHLNLVLRVCKENTFRQDKLFLALRHLEDLLGAAAQLPVAVPARQQQVSAASHPPATLSGGASAVPPLDRDLDSDLQDLTLISRCSK